MPSTLSPKLRWRGCQARCRRWAKYCRTAANATQRALLCLLLPALQPGVRVVSASFGGESSDPAEKQALDALRRAGILVVAAAGNAGTNNDDSRTPNYPANYALDNIVSGGLGVCRCCA